MKPLIYIFGFGCSSFSKNNKDLYKVKPGEVIKFKIQNEKFIKEDFDYWNIEDFVGEEKFESEKF